MSAPDHHDPGSELRLKPLGLRKLLPKRLYAWTSRYHESLVERAATEDIYFGAQAASMPWFMLVLVLLPVALIFRPSGPLWVATIVLISLVSLVGATYASVVFIVHALRAGQNRKTRNESDV